MIDVKSLSKSIDGNPIVTDVSFRVEKGEILGFIGPNGAGKTTTLRMLACATAPTSGTAEMFGLDLIRDDMEIRRILGYQPEVPPLYPFMSVIDYLKLVARLRGLRGRTIIGAVDEAIQRCKLTSMSRRDIGRLSKGYRQRVGLAQAILARPKVLLLDEPTASLDPAQINETRSIIQEYARDAAVIFSTHIMQEIRYLCHKIVVIKGGEVKLRQQIRHSDTAGNTDTNPHPLPSDSELEQTILHYMVD
jgi:ABC-2 type transport system ATP-binding protein